MKKIYIEGNYIKIIIDEEKGEVQMATNTTYYRKFQDHFSIENSMRGVRDVLVPFAIVGEIFNEAGDTPYTVESLEAFLELSTNTNIDGDQGYFGLLTDFYFGGNATATTITESDVDNWVDINFDINSEGKFDNRTNAMKIADPDGYDISTQEFNLEGLQTDNWGAFRASLSFDPDEDEGELSARLTFERHSGTTPVDSFPIEDTVVSMSQGADTDYPSEPYLTFFIGDTIDTNGPGDAGSCKFQIKSSVPGILSMRALTWYIYK